MTETLVDSVRALMRAHDATYEYADDYRIWSQGQRERDEIDRLSRDLSTEVVADLWNEKLGPTRTPNE